MKVVDSVRSYILDNELKITILNNKINVLNYKDIGHFDSNRVIIKSEKKDVLINGTDLVVSKLVTDEILITGVFTNIEFRW